MTQNLVIEYLSEIRQGNFKAILDTQVLSGTEKELALAIQDVISTIIAKNEWYEAILDAIPFPMSVTDMDMEWTFINRSTEKMLNVTRKDISGKHCSNWGANICKTPQCGIELLRNGINHSVFEQGGGHFRTDVSYIETKNGEKVGHVEIVTDITEVIKVNNYLRQEISLTSKNLQKLASGDLNLDYSIAEADEHTQEVSKLFVEMNKSLELATSALSLMTSDALMIAQAAVEGKLDTRAEATKHQGDFRKIVEGVNNTLDVLVGYIDHMPLPVMSIDTSHNILYVNETGSKLVGSNKKDLIGKKCFSQFNTGDCQTKNCACSLAMGSNSDVTRQTQAKPMGKDLEISYTGIPIKNKNGEIIGAFEFIQDQTASVKVTNFLKDEVEKLGNNLQKLSNGDTNLSIEVSKADEYIIDVHENFVQINEKLSNVNSTIKNLVSDALMLSEAGIAGKLQTRADASKHQGDFRKIVEGVNDTLDSVINPLNDMSHVLKRMTVNDYTRKLEKTYQGDFANVVIDLNMVMDRVNHIADSIVRIGEGNLSELDEFRKIGKRSDEDKVMPGFIRALEMLKALQDELLHLTKASQAGLLSERGRPEKFKGAYADVIKGTNEMLDAILLPIGEGNRILAEIRGGNLREKVEISCQGDHEKMKDAINGVHAWLSELIQFVTKIANGDMTAEMGKASDKDQIHEHLIKLRENIKALVVDANVLAQAAVDGKLATRANASKHQGDFQKIVKGVNDTLDSVIVPVNEALRVSQQYANYQFKARVDPSLKVTGDWVEFKKALDNIGIQISNAVGLINNQLSDLSSNAEEATASIEEVSAGAQQVALITRDVKRNAEVGNDGITQILKAMEDLNTTVGEVSRRAEQVSTFAVQANEFSKNGIDLAKKSESSMTEITRSSGEVELIVKEINVQMEEIGKIVRLISDIANQTNLLALNAAIEAARAGEAGRGFAVVAAEVKSLAQDSRKSAENIADMISTLQDKAQKATIAMAHSGEVVAEGSKSLNETLGAFNKIASSIEDITRNAMDVASASEEQAASVEEVTASIHEVSGLIMNTSKEAGDAAAATEEASASIEQISKVVTNVSGIVESVSREMSKFVV